MGDKVNFKQILTGLNSEFSFSLMGSHTSVKNSSLPYYLAEAGGRIGGFMLFPRVSALSEMQRASSMIWTRVVGLFSCDDNHYAYRNE